MALGLKNNNHVASGGEKADDILGVLTQYTTVTGGQTECRLMDMIWRTNYQLKWFLLGRTLVLVTALLYLSDVATLLYFRCIIVSCCPLYDDTAFSVCL